MHVYYLTFIFCSIEIKCNLLSMSLSFVHAYCMVCVCQHIVLFTIRIDFGLFLDSTNRSIDAPKPPPRQNARQNPFNRPAPPPPIYSSAPNPNAQGNADYNWEFH